MSYRESDAAAFNFEEDLLILTGYCATEFGDGFQEMIELAREDVCNNIILTMDKVYSGDDERVILPKKYDEIVSLDDNLRNMIVPFEYDERYASLDGKELVLIASTNTFNHMNDSLWYNVLEIEKYRFETFKKNGLSISDHQLARRRRQVGGLHTR